MLWVLSQHYVTLSGASVAQQYSVEALNIEATCTSWLRALMRTAVAPVERLFSRSTHTTCMVSKARRLPLRGLRLAAPNLQVLQCVQTARG